MSEPGIEELRTELQALATAKEEQRQRMATEMAALRMEIATIKASRDQAVKALTKVIRGLSRLIEEEQKRDRENRTGAKAIDELVE